MKLLCLVVIILILCLTRKNNSNFENLTNLYNGQQWNEYRLGDVYHSPPHILDPNDKENVLYHKYKFPGSIANEYINTNKEGPKNTFLLLKIINSKIKNKNNYQDTLFLHIRVGDVLCNFNDEWIRRINGPLYYSKKGDKVWWNGVLNYIKNKGINNVVIISGTHKPECLKQSSDYLLDRKNFLQQNIKNLNVSFRLGQSPDEDILTCAYVKHFITTGGGYGELIKEINNQLK